MKLFKFFVVASFLVLASEYASARDMTYKFGLGYRQSFTNAVVADAPGNPSEPAQINGLEANYGIAKDLAAGLFFGFTENFHFVSLGPTLRFELQRLINRESSVWDHLNIFTELKFLAKFGSEAKAGITIHAPYLGVEIFPFKENNFALGSSAGLVIDFVEKNRVGFTQGILGDLGLRYYF